MDGWIEGEEKKWGMEGGKEWGRGTAHTEGTQGHKSFWESDYSMQREMLALWSHCTNWWHFFPFFAHLPNLERAGFICGTLSASAMQVINMTEQGDILSQRSCQTSLILSPPLKKTSVVYLFIWCIGISFRIYLCIRWHFNTSVSHWFVFLGNIELCCLFRSLVNTCKTLL